MGKTKIMVSGLDLDIFKKFGKDPCGVCQKGIGSNAISCGGCLCWIHMKSNDIKGLLRPNPDFRCARCLGTARPIDGRTVEGVKVDKEKLEAVSEFCYLSLVDGRKKLGMDSVDLQNRSEWRGRLRERLVKQAEPSIEKNRLKMDMIMMMMIMMMIMMMMMMMMTFSGLIW